MELRRRAIYRDHGSKALIAYDHHDCTVEAGGSGVRIFRDEFSCNGSSYAYTLDLDDDLVLKCLLAMPSATLTRAVARNTALDPIKLAGLAAALLNGLTSRPSS